MSSIRPPLSTFQHMYVYGDDSRGTPNLQLIIDLAVSEVNDERIRFAIYSQIESCISPLQTEIAQYQTSLSNVPWTSPEFKEIRMHITGLKKGILSVIDAVINTYIYSTQKYESDLTREVRNLRSDVEGLKDVAKDAKNATGGGNIMSAERRFAAENNTNNPYRRATAAAANITDQYGQRHYYMGNNSGGVGGGGGGGLSRDQNHSRMGSRGGENGNRQNMRNYYGNGGFENSYFDLL